MPPPPRHAPIPPDLPPPPADLVAALADRYVIERELGQGGMATVYLAHDVRHERSVALKVLKSDLAHSLGTERFEREIRLAARLQHPHILTVLDSGASAGRLWFTMPYVEGESLRDRLNREHQLPIPDARRIAHEAALALDYAHQHGVVHRDIKPENLLLTEDGSTLVADFGIACALNTGDSHLTETGTSLGTAAYMSPEQAAGEREIDRRTDIYSLGIVLYEMLAGETPFAAATAQATIARRFTDVPRPLRSIRDRVPEQLERGVDTALARTAADRFATAREFADALAAIPASSTAATSASPVPPTTTVPQRRTYPTRIAALAFGVVLGLGVLFGWRRWTGTTPPPGAGLPRLAVLPFQNIGDTNKAYFADGMTDAIRGKLASLSGFRVIGRTSSAQYAGTQKSPAQIGDELGVQFLLTGTVQWAQSGDTTVVQVRPELVRVSDGTTRWDQGFRAPISDVFSVQAGIAGDVATALAGVLTDSTRRMLGSRSTSNLAAYEAFLHGQAAWDRGNGTSASKAAIGYYQQAVGLDSSYADAWSALSSAWTRLYVSGTSTQGAADAAFAAAQRALALASDKPGPHLALAGYFRWVRPDSSRAATELAEAIRIAPTDARALGAKARLAELQGQFDSALAYRVRALAIDPRDVSLLRLYGEQLLEHHRYPQARKAFTRAATINPSDVSTIQSVVETYLGEGNLTAARAALDSAPASVQPAELAAYLAQYDDLYWVLDDAQQRLVLALGPAAYAGDRGTWAMVQTQIRWLHGDSVGAREYADSAVTEMRNAVHADPDNWQNGLLLALALAYHGDSAEALATGRQALLAVAHQDRLTVAYTRRTYARIAMMTGRSEDAVDQLALVVNSPGTISKAWLRIDPTWAPLRGNPRFEALTREP